MPGCIAGRQAGGCCGISFYCGGPVTEIPEYGDAYARFAYKIVDDDTAKDDCVALVAGNDLSFLGVVAISDPIRPDVPAAVANASRQALASR